MNKVIYKVKGFDCASCASLLELDLEDAGIKAKCSYPREELEVEGGYGSKKLIDIVRKSGYTIAPK